MTSLPSLSLFAWWVPLRALIPALALFAVAIAFAFTIDVIASTPVAINMPILLLAAAVVAASGELGIDGNLFPPTILIG